MESAIIMRTTHPQTRMQSSTKDTQTASARSRIRFARQLHLWEPTPLKPMALPNPEKLNKEIENIEARNKHYFHSFDWTVSPDNLSAHTTCPDCGRYVRIEIHPLQTTQVVVTTDAFDRDCYSEKPDDDQRR